MILKLFLLLVAFLVARMMLRAFLPTRPRRKPDAEPRPPRTGGKAPEEPLRDLTRQKITDADYEELPPEE